MSDAVAVDAKRILLRYGAPISVLDKVSEAERIAFARTISRTTLAEREPVLRKLLVDLGYMEPVEERKGKKKGSRSHKGSSAGTGGSSTPKSAVVPKAARKSTVVKSAKPAKKPKAVKIAEKTRKSTVAKAAKSARKGKPTKKATTGKGKSAKKTSSAKATKKR